MKEKVTERLNTLIERYPVLSVTSASIEAAFDIFTDCLDNGGKLLIAGNGGSASDAEHIVGELMKGFCSRRPLTEEQKKALTEADPSEAPRLIEMLQQAIPAIALTSHPALSTAFGNDCDPEYVFAQQLYGIGRSGDVFLGISTSGNSVNILHAAAAARAKGIKFVALTGEGGGRMAEKADCLIAVPEKETYRVQELHLPVYHALCLMLEEYYF